MTNEEQNKKESEETTKPEEPRQLSLVEEAKAESEKLRTLLDEQKKLVQRQEELAAMQQLGGQVNNTPTEQPKEDSPKDYARKLMSGKV